MGRFDELRAAYETLISSQLNDDDEASVQELISLLATKVKQLGAKVLKSSLSPEPAADDDEGTASSTPPVPNDSSNEDASGEKAVADAHELVDPPLEMHDLGRDTIVHLVLEIRQPMFHTRHVLFLFFL